VAASHGGNGDLIRTPMMSVLPLYLADDGRPTHDDYKSGWSSVVGDALSLQLLPNASTTSSESSSSSSTWRPPTSTAELVGSSTQRRAAVTGPPEGRVPPAAWPGRPLPAPPTSVDGDSGIEVADDLAAVPRLDGERLRHIQTLGAGHFGEVRATVVHL